MDELNKLKDAWSIDDTYNTYDTSNIDSIAPSFATPKPLYGGSEEFGEIAPKNEGLHSFDIKNSLEKIRNLQSGSITPSQAWATGLMGLVPGLLGLAVGGNEGAADGFNIGSKVVGGYTDNIQKNNLQQAQTESALVRDAINEQQWQRRTDYQDTLQRDRAKDYIEAQKGLLDWKGEKGYVKDYNDPTQGGRGRPNLSPETNLELQDAIIKGEASPQLRAKILAEVGPYGAGEVFRNTGLNLSNPSEKLQDIVNVGKGIEEKFASLESKIPFMAQGKYLGRIERQANEFIPGTPEYQFAGEGGSLAFALTRLAQGSSQGISNQDTATLKKLANPSLFLGDPEGLRTVLAETKKIYKKYAPLALETARLSGTNTARLEKSMGIEPPATGFQGEVEGGLHQYGVNNLETEKSLAELDGQKVVDETVDSGVVNTMGKMKKQVNKRTGEVRYVPIN